MADSSLTLEMLIKEGRAVIGLNRVAEAETKVERGAGAINREAKKAEKALDDFARRTERINATPVEKYRTQMERLMETFRRGKIDQETFTRAVSRARDELKSAGQAQQQALGPRLLGQIGSFAAGYFTLSTAVRLVGDSFAHARRESEGALGSLRGLDDSRRKLAQLATDMPAGSLAGMQQRADKAAIASGASRSTAYEVLFQAHSYGFDKQYEEVMGMNPIIDPLAASGIAGKVKLMTGSQKSPSSLVAGLIEAGKPSEVDAETLAGPMAIALEGGRRIGGSAEQTMAFLSAMTMFYAGRGDTNGEGKAGAARVAGDRLRAFGHKVKTRAPQLAGGDWINAFEGVRNMSEAERGEFLGENEEVASVYEAYLESRDRVQSIYGRVVKAEELQDAGRGNVTLGAAIRTVDPNSYAALSVARGDTRKEVAREKRLALGYASASATLANMESVGYESGLNAPQRFGVSLFGGAASLTGSAWFTRRAGEYGGAMGTLMNPLLQSGDMDRYKGFVGTTDREANHSAAQQAAAAAVLGTAAEKLNAAADRMLNATGGASRLIAAEASAPLN